MDKKKSILNVSVSVGFKIATVILSIVVKRILIQTCGNEVNGLNALFLSIIGFLTVAELGIGSAITFCMYKPIVRGETDKVAALYHLFRRVYLLVGAVIFAAGLLITPFVHYFAKDYAQLNVDFYSTFVLMLVSVVLSYLFGAKTALINAYKNNYITTAIASGGILLQQILQIIVLYLTRSFAGYLVCRIVAVLAQWGITEIVTRKKYSAYLHNRQRIDPETRTEVVRNIRAMFMHKIGSLLVHTVDSVIISAFVGVVALGAYSNYDAIRNSMTNILVLLFSSLTSVFGHLYVETAKEKARQYAELFHVLNFMIGMVFYLGYYAVADSLVAILFGADLVAEKSVTTVIAVNGFVQFLRQSTLVFRDATGTFYNDRWKPLFEGITNVVLSILFVKRMGVVGVLVATMATNLLICHIVEPYVLYKHAFGVSPIHYYIRNYGMILVFVASVCVMGEIMVSCGSGWETFWINGMISLGISGCVTAATLLIYPETGTKIMGWIRRQH